MALEKGCPCCNVYKDGLEFKKVMQLERAGLVIYRHATPMNSVACVSQPENAFNIHDNVFIIHNTKNSNVSTSNYMSEFEQAINCPRCRYIVKHTKELLLNVPFIRKKDVIGICDRCRFKKNINERCNKCNLVVEQFLRIQEQKQTERRGSNKKEKLLTLKIKHILKDAPKAVYEKTKTQFRSETSLKKSLSYKTSPTYHVPRVKDMFEIKDQRSKETYKNKKHLKTKQKGILGQIEIQKLYKNKSDSEITFTEAKRRHQHHEPKKNILFNSAENIAWPKSSNESAEFIELDKKQQHRLRQKLKPKIEMDLERQSSTELEEYLKKENDIISPINYETQKWPSEKLDVLEKENIKKTKKEQHSYDDIHHAKYDQAVSKFSQKEDSFVREIQKPSRSVHNIRRYSSEETLLKSASTTTEPKLHKDFSYCFIKETDVVKKPPRKHASSSELIKDTQDMYRARAEEERIKKEQELKEKLEAEEKKRLAKIERERHQEEERRLEELRKKKAEEERRLEELKKKKAEEEQDANKKKLSKKDTESPKRSVKASKESSEKSKSIKLKTELKESKIDKSLKSERDSLKSKKDLNKQEKEELMRLEKERKFKDKSENEEQLRKAKEEKRKEKEDKEKANKEEQMRLAKDEKQRQKQEKDKEKANKKEQMRLDKEEKQRQKEEKDKKKANKEEQMHLDKEEKQRQKEEKDKEKANKEEQMPKGKDEKQKEKVEKDKEQTNKEDQMRKANDVKQRQKEDKENEKANKEEQMRLDKEEKQRQKEEKDKEKANKEEQMRKAKEEKQKEKEEREQQEAQLRIEKEKNRREKEEKLRAKEERQKEKEQIRQAEENERAQKENEEKLKNKQLEQQLIDQQKDKELKLKKRQEEEEKKKEAQLKLKSLRETKAEEPPEEPHDNKFTEESKMKDLNINQVKIRKNSPDDLILQLVKLKQTKGGLKERPTRMSQINIPKKTLFDHTGHKNKKKDDCIICLDSDLELDIENIRRNETKTEEINDIIIGQKIFKYKHSLVQKKEDKEVKPLLFNSTHTEGADNIVTTQELKGNIAEKKEIKPPVKYVEREVPKGIIRYALSDRTFIEKGWTMLPTEKVVRKMNVYRMRPAHPEFDWFEHNKTKKLICYDTGEKLAEFDDNGRGRWFYRSGKVALDYYDTEEVNALHRIVIFSSGEPDERGCSRPFAILATFDYLGNGVVFDHSGKIRLKYNQTKGVVLDRSIGPVSHWKWHTLNDPPVLQQVMIDTQMAHKDPEILKLGGPQDDKPRPDNEEMLAIEFDNFIKEKSKKLSQKFKPFQIKMKALKINEYFSLKVLDQATIYLIYRDGSTNLKLNIGMILDHQEIVDTDTAEVGEVSNSLERFPARTDSLAGLQKSVAHAQRVERARVERTQRLRPTQPCASADRLVAGLGRPLRPPPPGHGSCQCRKPPTLKLYYDTRPI